MIKKWWGRITRKGSEEGEYPIQQATYLGRVSDFFVLFPYGMHANLPADQLGLLIDRQGRIFMGTSAVGRITVEEGEVVFYHPKTKSRTLYKNNGDIDIDTTTDDIVGNVNVVTKNANITTSEKVVVNAAGDVEITAPTLAVDGDVTVTGSVTASGEVTGNGVALSTHTHPYSWTDPAGSGDTDPPN